MPTQESKSWTAEAPAETWICRNEMVMSVSRASRACHSRGLPYRSAFVRSWFFDGPPSTRYDASVNGPPAKPISGVLPSSATSELIAGVR